MTAERCCSREGCERRTTFRTGKERYCSAVCRSVDIELTRTQRVCEAVGSQSVDLWCAAVAMSDAVTEYLLLDEQLHQAATEVGITDERWLAIKYGHRCG